MRALAVVALLATLAGRARAHDVRGEIVRLEIGDRTVEVELRVPLQQLELIHGHVDLGARTDDGRAFTTRIDSSERDGDWQVVHATLEAPDGADAHRFVLRDDTLLAHLTTATVYVFVHDHLAGYLHYQARELVVEKPPELVDDTLAHVVALRFARLARQYHSSAVARS